MARHSLVALLLAVATVAADGKDDHFPFRRLEEAKSRVQNCTLRDGVAEKPYPSLTQCYKYNTDPGSCCVSAHDEEIHRQYAGFFSSTCLREYPELEFYFCVGCNPDEQKFTDSANKVIRVCKAFAVRHIYPKNMATAKPCGTYLTEPGSLETSCPSGCNWEVGSNSCVMKPSYDHCGVNIPCKTLKHVFDNFSPTGSTKSIDKVVGCADFAAGNDPDATAIVIPSKVFGYDEDGYSTEAFLNALKPPFFGDFTIELVGGDGKDSQCSPRTEVCKAGGDVCTSDADCPADDVCVGGYSTASSLAAFSFAAVALVAANALAQL